MTFCYIPAVAFCYIPAVTFCYIPAVTFCYIPAVTFCYIPAVTFYTISACDILLYTGNLFYCVYIITTQVWFSTDSTVLKVFGTCIHSIIPAMYYGAAYGRT